MPEHVSRLLKAARSLRWAVALIALLPIALISGASHSREGDERSSPPPDYLLIKATVPEPRDVKWWQKRHDEKVRLAKSGQAELIMIGDSLVHNFEKRGKQIWHLYFGRYKPLNLGFNADQTEHALWRLQNGELDGISPQLAIVMIGTNNGGLRRDLPKYTYAGIAAIIAELRSRLPDTEILLLGIFPRGALKRHPLRKLNAEVNTLLPALAKDPSVHFMDISGLFLDDRKILHRDIMFDFLHPTIAGYQIWAEAISPTVVKLMAK